MLLSRCRAAFFGASASPPGVIESMHRTVITQSPLKPSAIKSMRSCIEKRGCAMTAAESVWNAALLVVALSNAALDSTAACINAPAAAAVLEDCTGVRAAVNSAMSAATMVVGEAPGTAAKPASAGARSRSDASNSSKVVRMSSVRWSGGSTDACSLQTRLYAV